jgi:hypothetical protein
MRDKGISSIAKKKIAVHVSGINRGGQKCKKKHLQTRAREARTCDIP